MKSKKEIEQEREKARLEALQETERKYLKGTFGDFFGSAEEGGTAAGNLTFGEEGDQEKKSSASGRSSGKSESAGSSAGDGTGRRSRIDELAKRGEEIVSAVRSKNDALQRANDALREVQSLLDNPLYDGMPSMTGVDSGKDGSRDPSAGAGSGIDPSLMAGSSGDLFTDFIGADSGAGGNAGHGADQVPGPSAAGEGALPTAQAAGPEVPEAPEKPAEPEKDPMEELDSLIGLEKIKADVRELTDFVKIQKLRGEGGLRSVPVSLHLVFTGNPGTGKTTVARILAKLYRQIGVLSKGQLVEVDRSGLVAGYVGQTALKTAKKIEEARGGVLFIDEAYALARKDDTFGQEAIDTILKAMEDSREDFVVIVAGYTGPMETFINSNPGLKSRFNKYIEFPDYTIDELMGIFDMNCRKYDYEAEDDVKAQIRAMIVQRKLASRENFANAREVRNLFEEIITNQARRVAAMEAPTQDQLKQILLDDLDETAEADLEAAVAKAAETEPIIIPEKDLEKDPEKAEEPDSAAAPAPETSTD